MANSLYPLILIYIFLCVSAFLTNYVYQYLQYPVYFAFEDDKINAVLADVRRNDATGQPPMATTGGLVDLLIC